MYGPVNASVRISAIVEKLDFKIIVRWNRVRMSDCFVSNKDYFHHLIVLNVIFIVNWQCAHVGLCGVCRLYESFRRE